MKDITKYNGLVLSLERDIDRREDFFHQLSTLSWEQCQIDFNTFFAIDAKNEDNKVYIDTHFDFTKAQELYGRKLSYGEAACSLSHIEMYRSLVKNEQNYSIVCEDDAKIHPDFPILGQILENSVFDIIVFGESKVPSFSGNPMYKLAYPLQFKPKVFGRYKLGCIYGFYTPGTVGYAISKKALKSIVEATEKEKIFWLADDFQTIIEQVFIKCQYKITIGHIFPRLVIENLSIVSHLESERVKLQSALSHNAMSFGKKVKHKISLFSLRLYFWRRLLAYQMFRDLK